MLKTKKIILNFYRLLFVGLTLLAIFLFFGLPPKVLSFYVFDVGQGDATLIRTPNHFNILVDGGPDNNVVYKLGKYLPFYDRQIDLMILTHPHSDHIAGLIEVLRRYQVKKIFTTGVIYNSVEYSIWQETALKEGSEIKIINHPQNFISSDGVKLEILFPDRSLKNQKLKNVNNASIVAKLVYRDAAILLTGDYEEEEKLITRNLDLQADILKVGHHGSKTANNLEFLRVVQPKLAIISVGAKNPFNHPSPQTLADLASLKIKAFRTDQDGDFIYTFLKE